MPHNIKPLFGTGPDRSHPRYRNILAHYMFNENVGNLVNEISAGSTVGNAIAPSGNEPEWYGGPNGPAMKFISGNSDQLVANDFPELVGLTEFAVVYRFIPLAFPSEGNYYGLLSSFTATGKAEIDFFMDTTSGNVELQLNINSTTPGNDRLRSNQNILTIGQLETVVMSWGPSGPTFYLNGKDETALTEYHDSFALTASSQQLIVGNDVYDDFSDMIVDEIRIYNREISAAEARSFYRDPYAEF